MLQHTNPVDLLDSTPTNRTGVVVVQYKIFGNILSASVNYIEVYRMFEQFSKGYYLGRLYVEPSSSTTARICRDQHEQVNQQLYADGGDVERLDWPLVIKLGSQHLAVHGDEEVPADTLAVPEPVLEETTVRNPPSLQEVFLAKADRAAQLLEFTGGPAGQ